MTKAKAILIACLVFIVGLSSAAPAQAVKLGPRPPWGACGVSTASSKVVYDYGFIQLQCGDANWGYRHIKDRHYTEFQVLAAPAGLNWSDLVHWAIYYTAADPDHVRVSGSTGCRDRMLYLHDNNGRLVLQKRFRMIYNAGDGRVVTTYPTDAVC